MDGLTNSTNAPLFITREGLQDLIENYVNAASCRPSIHDGFLELIPCDWCHRRVGQSRLSRGLCPACHFSIRGAMVIAKQLSKLSKGA